MILEVLKVGRAREEDKSPKPGNLGKAISW